MISADLPQGLHAHPEAACTGRMDLRVSHSFDRGAWTVEMLSPRARLWAQSSLNCDRYDRTRHIVQIDAEGANSLIQRARFAGLVCDRRGECLVF